MTRYELVCVHSDPEQLLLLQSSLAVLGSHFNLRLYRDHHHWQQAELSPSAIALIVAELTSSTLTLLSQHAQQHPETPILVLTPSELSLLPCLINQARVDLVLEGNISDTQLHQINQLLCHFLRQRQGLTQELQTLLGGTSPPSLNPSQQTQFLDYGLYSDTELSALVINTLYRVFKENDEQHVCRNYSKNHLLTREGEHNNALWFIAKGEVQLKKSTPNSGEQEVTVMRSGSMVGGMSFITGEPAFTTSITLTETEVIKLEKNQFATLMKSNSELLGPFTHLLLRNFNRRLQGSIITKLKLQSTLQSLDAAHAQLVETEKMAVLGQLVAGIAHELNNPVAAILRGTDTLKTKVPFLLDQDLDIKTRQLGATTLNHAMKITPLSTALIRQRTKAAIPLFGNNALARKAVQMELDSPEKFHQHFAKSNPSEMGQSIKMLDNYYLVGNFLRSIDVCAKRIADLVKGLKHYAGQDVEQAVFADIHEGIEETLVIFENKLKAYEVIKTYQSIPLVQCHPIELQQIWTNLIANAIDATQGVGSIQISTSSLVRDQRDYICVSVEDNGPGIAKSKQAAIFELNYTTKREGNFGLGIGLTVCQQIIKRHHGEITVSSCTDEENHFTRFDVYLPVINPIIKQRARAENLQESQ
ncbi:ATP-binding protein [Motilimonas eburnea]|uniref:ATP-binding protein n=1 Tax=Motilimonas eburnea TaxID=1737488 RepID=UPI001E3AE638|nr:ATP-binding protein [Motilimonas eburnea]MCE2570591.1 cyclic nucleotide-binding domain-containing protein [Motilimonas eburnea]